MHLRVVVLLIAFTGALSFRTSVISPTTIAEEITNNEATRSIPVPDDRLFELLFVKHAFLLSKALKRESQGGIGLHLRTVLAAEIGLNETEASALDRIATDSIQQIQDLDQKALRIISSQANKYPGGKLPYGVTPPPIPPELFTMKQQRLAIIVSAQ